MKNFLLISLLAMILAICTITVFSCDLIDIELEEDAGARPSNDQEIVYEKTISQSID